MEDDKSYRSTAVAEILGIPHPTIRTWDQQGHIPFVRANPGEWRKFKLPDIIRLGVMAELSLRGIPPKLASLIVSRLPAEVTIKFPETLTARYLVIGGFIGGTYKVLTASDLSSIELPEFWADATFYDTEGERANEPYGDLPKGFIVIDLLRTYSDITIKAIVPIQIGVEITGLKPPATSEPDPGQEES